jgi:hypothetical protein
LFDARVDDLDRGRDVLGGGEYVEQFSGLPRTNASSTSMRGAMKRLASMSPPCSKNMSSISGAKSGSVIWLACCIAREVRPILRPLIVWPSASSSWTQARWIA